MITLSQKILRLRYFYVIINQITKRSDFMAITYRKLFHLLIDRNIKKGELQEKAGITASIMARLAKDETVKSDTIGKICDALQCQPGDIMEYVPAGNIQESVPLSQRAKEPKTLDEMNEKVPTLSELHNKNNFLA